MIAATGDFAQINNCPPTLPGADTFGTTCTITVTFMPEVAGLRTGTLTTGSAFAQAALTGTGVAPPAAVTAAPSAGVTAAAPRRCKRKRKRHAVAAKKRCKRKIAASG